MLIISCILINLSTFFWIGKFKTYKCIAKIWLMILGVILIYIIINIYIYIYICIFLKKKKLKNKKLSLSLYIYIYK